MSALRRFAKGLPGDLLAARAGLWEVRSIGMSEGFGNKLKLLKRQGYGRARLPVRRPRMSRGA